MGRTRQESGYQRARKGLPFLNVVLHQAQDAYPSFLSGITDLNEPFQSLEDHGETVYKRVPWRLGLKAFSDDGRLGKHSLKVEVPWIPFPSGSQCIETICVCPIDQSKSGSPQRLTTKQARRAEPTKVIG